MKILAWNYQGLVSSRAIRALLEVQKREKPNVLFLPETFGESEGKKFEEETRLRQVHQS
jgi:hypothetical protein